MVSISVTTAWRDSLEEARATGILTVEYDGRRVTYRTDADLAAGIVALNAQIAASQGRRITDVLIWSSKGLT